MLSRIRFSRILSICCIALALAMFTSCGDDDDDDDSIDNNTDVSVIDADDSQVSALSAGALTAKVDGQDFRSQITAASFADGRLTVVGSFFPQGVAVNATNVGKSSQTGFDVRNVTGAGAYPIGSDVTGTVILAGGSADGTRIAPYATNPERDSGEVKIDTIDSNSAKGSFSFTATNPLSGNQIEIIGGTFDVKFNVVDSAQ